jgi:transcriptional pleiotropic regulator of transition state genes
MKTTKIIRRLDRLGRLVIPRELRSLYGIGEETPIAVSVGEDESIILRKYSQTCSLCGEDSPNLNSYLKADLCDNCFKLVSHKG